jgi:hypothetical protein
LPPVPVFPPTDITGGTSALKPVPPGIGIDPAFVAGYDRRSFLIAVTNKLTTNDWKQILDRPTGFNGIAFIDKEKSEYILIGEQGLAKFLKAAKDDQDKLPLGKTLSSKQLAAIAKRVGVDAGTKLAITLGDDLFGDALPFDVLKKMRRAIPQQRVASITDINSDGARFYDLVKERDSGFRLKLPSISVDLSKPGITVKAPVGSKDFNFEPYAGVWGSADSRLGYGIGVNVVIRR